MRTALNVKKVENFKSRKKLSLSHPVEQRDSVFQFSGDDLEGIQRLVVYFTSMDGIKKNEFLIRHLIGFETTAIAAFRLAISMKSIFSDTHCFIVTVGAIQGCYGDCSSWQHRDVICVIAHPYCSCIEHTHAAIAHISVRCNKRGLCSTEVKSFYSETTTTKLSWMTQFPKHS